MKVESSVGIDIMRQVGEAARTAPKKPEEIPAEESSRGVKRDEYVPSEKDEPIGLYSMEQDENGDPEIKFDDPNKSDKSDKSDKADKAEKPEKEKSESEECTCNTDKVDRELKRLREKAERLEQQLRSASEEEAAKLRKQLAEVQSELAQKDNDSYRRSQAEFS
ncbi:MAG: hypothetical protein K2J11_04125 [Oscillospiraceae bacterium]|nr:hypothetical protein [Oscillospiraceae bacterium]